MMKSDLWVYREFITELIKRNVPQGERLLVLNKMAIEQMTSVLGCTAVKELGVER
jgi:hypothetical protein